MRLFYYNGETVFDRMRGLTGLQRLCLADAATFGLKMAASSFVCGGQHYSTLTVKSLYRRGLLCFDAKSGLWRMPHVPPADLLARMEENRLREAVQP